MTTPLSSLVKVVHGTGEFSSKLVSLVDRNPGAILAKIEGETETSQRAYDTLQVSEDTDLQVTGDLLYCNHSCDPSVVFDTERMEVRVVEKRALKAGDDITYFYPSTEWDMQQPFQCNCGSAKCIGLVSGAKDLDDVALKQQYMNPHIVRLMSKRRQ